MTVGFFLFTNTDVITNTRSSSARLLPQGRKNFTNKHEYFFALC